LTPNGTHNSTHRHPDRHRLNSVSLKQSTPDHRFTNKKQRSRANRRKDSIMRIAHRLAKPLPRNIPLLVGTVTLVLCLLALSLLLSFSQTSNVALASSPTLHPF